MQAGTELGTQLGILRGTTTLFNRSLPPNCFIILQTMVRTRMRAPPHRKDRTAIEEYRCATRMADEYEVPVYDEW